LYKSLAVAFLALVLASCGTVRQRPGPPPKRNPPPEILQSLPAAGTYKIDTGQSELRLLVYRAGALANLGHNHVMVNRAVSGSIVVGADLSASSFWLSVPVNSFEVDAAGGRHEEGAEFSDEVSPQAKSGTLHNMLSATVLNAAQFPFVTVKSLTLNSAPSGAVGQPTATLTISVAGHDSSIDAAFNLQADSQQIAATGTFELSQKAVGLTPYSLMGGALSVRDVIQVKFKIVAALS
jgi:polyisoprenoid-binding protein YceI